MENLAKVEENLSSAQANADIARVEAELAKEAISRVVEDFRCSDEYQEELLESDFISYRVGYEDAWGAAQGLYPELDLSSVVPPGSEDQVTEEVADPLSGDHTTVEEAVPDQVAEGEAAPTPDATSAQVDTPIAPELLSVEEADSDE